MLIGSVQVARSVVQRAARMVALENPSGVSALTKSVQVTQTYSVPALRPTCIHSLS